MAELFETRGFGPAKIFLTAARKPEAIADLDPAARDLEGYLFPATYALSPHRHGRGSGGHDGRRVSDRSGPMCPRARDLKGMTVRQVMALASLVEKETAAPDERPLVAAVYRNRLEQRMGLQADPTVVYALSKAGRYNGNIRKVDLEHRLAVQHLPLSGPAARPDRGAGPGVARGGARARRRAVSLLRQPQRRHARVRRDAGRAQRQRAEVSGGVLPAASLVVVVSVGRYWSLAPGSLALDAQVFGNRSPHLSFSRSSSK